MYAMIVVVIVGLNPAYSRVGGSAEFRFADRESCLQAQEQVKRNWQVENHRVMASCIFKPR
jgi:hypothetical protein